MLKVYMFSQESMYMDLLDSEIEDIESIASNIIAELELSKAIIIDGTYIIGNVTAFLLKEKYQIVCQEVELT